MMVGMRWIIEWAPKQEFSKIRHMLGLEESLSILWEIEEMPCILPYHKGIMLYINNNNRNSRKYINS